MIGVTERVFSFDFTRDMPLFLCSSEHGWGGIGQLLHWEPIHICKGACCSNCPPPTGQRSAQWVSGTHGRRYPSQRHPEIHRGRANAG